MGAGGWECGVRVVGRGALVGCGQPGSVDGLSLPLDVVKLPSRKRRSALATRSPSSPEPPGTRGLRQPEWDLSWLRGGRHPSSPGY